MPEEKNTFGLTGHQIEIIHLNNETKILAYTRTHKDHLDNPTLIVLNLSSNVYGNYKIGSPKSNDLKTIFNSTWQGYDSDDFETVETKLTIVENEECDHKEHSLSFAIDSYAALIIN